MKAVVFISNIAKERTGESLKKIEKREGSIIEIKENLINHEWHIKWNLRARLPSKDIYICSGTHLCQISPSFLEGYLEKDGDSANT